MMKNKTISVNAYGWIYFFVHLFIEVACFFLVYNRFLGKPLYVLIALAYDCLAFVPQIFIGILADRFPKLKIGAIGGILSIIALLLPFDIPALILICLGNGFIHVEGAEKTLRNAGGKMAPSAIFVAGGSFGVIAGQLLAAYPLAGTIISVSLMVIVTVVSLLVPVPENEKNCEENPANQNKEPPLCGFHCENEKLSFGLIVLLAFITVAARSLASYAIPTSWVTETWHKVLMFCLMGVGKGVGGVLADRLGARRIGVVTLLLAAPLLCIGESQIVVSLAGIMLFSMTMPVTLGVLVSCFDKNPGFAFGITTVGLFCGVLPFFFYQPADITMRIVLVSVLSVIAAVCFLFCASNDAAGQCKNK